MVKTNLKILKDLKTNITQLLAGAETSGRSCRRKMTMKELGCLLVIVLFQLTITQGAPSPQTACGRPRIAPRIVGGQDALEGAWPWHASLLLDLRPICSASLINEQWVLTAANCFYGSHSIEQYNILLGAHQLLNLSYNVALHSVQQIFIHPNYEGKVGSSGDIALLKLDTPVMFSSLILPICLPRASQNFSSNTDCWVAGWGAIKEDEALPPPLTLQEVKVPIMNRRLCNNLFNMFTVQGLMKDPVKEDMLCAGYQSGGKDSCKGDAGGALVCRSKGVWTQVGIVSWGVGCAERLRPGVYTLVSYYDDWINSKISRG